LPLERYPIDLAIFQFAPAVGHAVIHQRADRVPPHYDIMGFGPRVPLRIISPWAKRVLVDHRTHEFSSVLRFIGSVFGVNA
jgi:phospholipase C